MALPNPRPPHRILRTRAGLAFAALVGAVLLLAPASAPYAHAQEAAGSSLGQATNNPLDLLRRRLGENSMAASLLPLEGAVDPDEYIVGPGDFFTVVIGSFEGSASPIPVSADGMLILPDAGSVAVAGLTLTEAKTLARGALAAAFGKTPADLTLSQPRQFYVHVSGAVPVPGRYLSLPAGRVSSALELAFSDTTRAPVTNLDYRPSLRNVSLVRRDGSELSLDLMQYFSAGATGENPYLQDGDVVIVPGYDPAYGSIRVDGAVPFPGSYDARPDDNLRSVLRAAGSVTPALHVGQVRVVTGSSGAVRTVPMADALSERGTRVRVAARDHVSVTPDNLPGGTATIDGWVFNPGTYPIQEGETTLRDLIDRAGGLRSDAQPSRAFVERRALPDPTEGMQPADRLSGNLDLMRLMAADTLAILQQMRLTDLDFLSRAYFAQELRTQNRVSLNVASALAEGAEPVMLRDGDRLVIPRDDKTVFVAGQVIRPGFVLFAAGQHLEDYVSTAGGRGAFAATSYLIKGSTGEVIEGGNGAIESGDVIFVDREEDLATDPELQRLVIQERTARSDARIRVAQTVIQSISAIATVIALIVSINR